MLSLQYPAALLARSAAACDMERHCIDFSQAFIQADWAALLEKSPQYFIQPPSGWEEEPGVVYECLRPLYEQGGEEAPSTPVCIHPEGACTSLLLGCKPVKTPMEPGVCLSKSYCPSVDPTVHAEYCAIVGHISFMWRFDHDCYTPKSNTRNSIPERGEGRLEKRTWREGEQSKGGRRRRRRGAAKRSWGRGGGGE
eukprot:505839-Rhodomonas_salina.2